MNTNNRRRVVVTGLGAITPIGNDIHSFWEALLKGENGVAPITKFDAEKYDTRFAAEVKNFDAIQFIEKKNIRRMDLFSQYSLASSEMALLDAKIDLSKINLERFGVIYGSGIGGLKSIEDQCETFFPEKDPKKLSPFFVTMMIADIAAGHISIKFGLKGPNYSTTSACATASHSISDAFMHIQRGSADMMICGGSEAAITQFSIGGFNAMKALSTWNDRYREASRPFDKDRNGFVMGEGAGTLVLEELNHALNRGATIYAELAGIGITADAHHITAPEPSGDGAIRAMKLAIDDAGLTPNDIDHINAHGTSTPYNDVTETKAIKTVFSNHAYDMVVCSIKSMTGHLLGAAGGIEAIATVLSVKNDIVPPTINLISPDPECDLNYSALLPTRKKIDAAISNTFGFGGHNASLLFKKFKE